jgi:hypothetical protein
MEENNDDSEKSVQKLEELLKCSHCKSVCTDPEVKMWKGCNETICENCINSSLFIECPVCNQLHDRKNVIPNRYLSGLVKILSNKNLSNNLNLDKSILKKTTTDRRRSSLQQFEKESDSSSVIK